jgi:hypothetical protein
MLRMGFKSIFSLIAVFTLYTCIDPFNPKITGNESILVVDGALTDANTSSRIRLSRTVPNQDSNPVMVSNATLFISDDAGQSSFLVNEGNGIYKTDSLDFKGVAGRTYVLHIKTGEGMEYESEPCLMQPGANIDSVYFTKDKELVNNGTESLDGIRIFIDSKGGGPETFYRWDFDETWKFKVPNPKKYDFNAADTTFLPHNPVNEFGWKYGKSDLILTHSDVLARSGTLEKMPLYFIASGQSDRLLIQYSILVRQHSISKKEYDFWENIKEVDKAGEDVFSKQPYPVDSNLHNISNPDEKVLGYFQVYSVSEKRTYITISEIARLNLPYYHYPCTRIEMAPWDYPRSPLSPPLTWSDLYDMFCVTSDYYLVEPKYKPGSNELDKMVFTTPECADSELTGTSTKPDFWTDLE